MRSGAPTRNDGGSQRVRCVARRAAGSSDGKRDKRDVAAVEAESGLSEAELEAVREGILNDIILKQEAKEAGAEHESDLKALFAHVDAKVLRDMKRAIMRDIRQGRRLRKASDRKYKRKKLSREERVRRVRDEVLADVRRGHKHRLRRTEHGRHHARRPKHFGLDENGQVVKIKVTPARAAADREKIEELRRKEAELQKREEALARKEKQLAKSAEMRSREQELLKRKQELEERQRKLQERSQRLAEKASGESSASGKSKSSGDKSKAPSKKTAKKEKQAK